MSLAAAKPFAAVAYPMDEAAGIAVDAVGTNDLTDNNTVGADASGPFGNCRRFVAANSESFGGADGAIWEIGSDQSTTWCVWLKKNNPGTFGVVFAKKGNNGNEYLLWWVGSGFGNTYVFEVWDSANTSHQAKLPDGTGNDDTTWHLFICRYNASAREISISMDGGAWTTAAFHATNAPNTTTEPFYIGREPAGTYWQGDCAEYVFLPGYLFTDADRDELWNGGAGVAFADWDAGGGGTPVEGAGYAAAGSWALGVGSVGSVGSGFAAAGSWLGGLGSAGAAGLGLAAGSSWLLGSGLSGNAGSGLSVGSSTALSVGQAVSQGVGYSAGSSWALGSAATAVVGVGVSFAGSSATGAGLVGSAGVGRSTGLAWATGIGLAGSAGTGIAAGSALAAAVGSAVSAGTGFAAGSAWTTIAAVGSPRQILLLYAVPTDRALEWREPVHVGRWSEASRTFTWGD